MMDKFLKLSNPKCNTPVSDPLQPKCTSVCNIDFNKEKNMMMTMMIPSRRREDEQSTQP